MPGVGRVGAVRGFSSRLGRSGTTTGHSTTSTANLVNCTDDDRARPAGYNGRGGLSQRSAKQTAIPVGVPVAQASTGEKQEAVKLRGEGNDKLCTLARLGPDRAPPLGYVCPWCTQQAGQVESHWGEDCENIPGDLNAGHDAIKKVENCCVIA